MASNTSKTAHVMNLLSKNRGSAAETPAEPAPQAEPAPPAEPAAPQAQPARSAPVAPIISSINADAAVSSQIKDALEAELEPAAPAQQAASVQKAAPVQQAAPVQKAADLQQTASVQQAASVQQTADLQAESIMDLPAAEDDSSVSEEHVYTNVMQILVEEKADEYMKMFGICCCDKCRVDVRAYALNRLPPKYVVLSKHERVPRLTVYENRFASDITAQLVQACKQVMLTPHHSREND